MGSLPSSIKEARERAGFTQKQVESKLGLRSLQVRDYEIGRLKLPVKIALQLAELYSISIEQLIGHKKSDAFNWDKCQALSGFQSIFTGSGFSVMFLDPILRGFLEEKKDQIFEKPFFEVLTSHLADKDKKAFINELCEILFIISCSDGKVDTTELDCIKNLLAEYKLSQKYQQVKNSKLEVWLEKEKSSYFKNIEIKHFVVWLLFLFAMSDGEIVEDEHKCIEAIAEKIKVNKSNFVNIKKQFTKEEV